MADDDVKLNNYQDDLDTDPNKRDKITEETEDYLADRAGIPRGDLAHELKKYSIDELGRSDEDARETIEDADEDMDEPNESR